MASRLSFAETGTTKVLGGYDETSDQFRKSYIDLSYFNHRRDLLYPYDGEAEEASDFGARFLGTSGSIPGYNYTGYRLVGTAGRKFSKSYFLSGSFGFHALRTQNLVPVTAPVGEAFAAFLPSEWINGSIQYSHDLVYQDLIQPGGVTEGLSANTVSGMLLFLVDSKVRVPFNASYSGISDGNAKTLLDMAVMYGISPGTPWIWVGMGGNILWNSFQAQSYWSPSQYSTFGPRLDLSIPYQRFSFNVNGNLNRFYDQDAMAAGYGYYVAGTVQYGSRDEQNISVGYVGIQSAHGTSSWNSNSFILNFSKPI